MAGRLDTELLITAGVDGLQHIDRLINSIDAAGGDTEQLREASQRLRDEWNSLSADEQARRLRDLGNAANQGADDVDILGQNTDETTSAFDRMKSTVMALAAALGIAFIIGKIKGFFTDAVEGAAEFEQQLKTVQAVSGATVAEMEQIKAASEELGKTTRYTATQAAEGFEILSRAGLSTAQALETIPSVLALAQGNGLELADAAGFITNAVQGMSLSFADSARVADVLAKGASSANTDVAGLGAALSYAAPSAAALGLSIEDVTAYIGQFANAGIDASRAGTSFNGMLSQFSNSTSAFRRELANIGITTDNFNDAIAQLAAAGTTGQKAINALGMEAGPALKALLAQGMPALDALKNKMYDAEGAAQSQADTMNSTWQGAMTSLGSAWDSLKNKLGESFLAPMAQSFKDLGAEVVALVDSGKIKALSDSLSRIFTEGSKSVIDFIRNLDFAALIEKVSGALDSLRNVGAGINGAFQALSIVFNGFKAGLLAVGVAVSMVVTVFVELNKLTLDTGRAIAGFFGITSNAADGASKAMGSALQASEDFREFATAEIASAGKSITDSFQSIATSADESATDSSNALAQIPAEYADSIRDVQEQTTKAFSDIVAAAESSGADAATQAAQIREQVASMMQGFDQPEQFAALIKSITETGNEAVVGAELLEQMGTAAAKGSSEAQAAAEQAKTAIAGLGSEAQKQADEANAAINNTFAALNIDVAQSLTGINSKTQQTFDLVAHGAQSIADSSYDAADKARLLTSLFNEGMNAAKTAEEFKVLNEMVRAHGLSSVVTAEQRKALNLGMQGGVDAIKAAADAEAAQTAELEKNAAAAAKNAEQNRKAAAAKDEQAAAAAKAAEANTQATQTESVSLAVMQQATNAIRDKISALSQMGATTEQTDAAWRSMMSSIEGRSWIGLSDFGRSIDRINAAVDKQIDSFTRAKDRADEMTRALGGAEVSSKDLADAQHALRQATDASVEGIVRMDEQTLSGLQNAIDSARSRMQGLSDDARNTADQLEASLARMQGNNDRAREIEQTRKLTELEERLQEAKARGNNEEIKQLERALDLQKQINREEEKKARQESSQSTPRPSNSTSNTSSKNGGTSSVSASDVAAAWQAQIAAAKKEAAAEAVEQFAKQLIEEGKRSA